MAAGFRDLKIWQKSYELAIEVRKLTAKLPKEGKYGLVDQVNRSSASIMALIAESHGRFYFKDQVRVLYEARGEIQETRSHLSLALGLKFITEKEFERLDLEYEGLDRGVSSYIKSLANNGKK